MQEGWEPIGTFGEEGATPPNPGSFIIHWRITNPPYILNPLTALNLRSSAVAIPDQ
jgi:hypothetical protein